MKAKTDFPIFDAHPELVYLDSAATTHKPKQVIDAISDFYSSEYGTVHRGIYDLSVGSTQRYTNARKAIQAFIHAPNAHNIIFTKGTTDSINLVAFGYAMNHINEGDELLITEIEHHANFVPWQQVAQLKKARLVFAPIEDSGELDIETFFNCITEKTKLIAMTHISNVLGTLFPVHQIISKAKSLGIPILIDGAQAIAHEPINCGEMDPDFYCFSGHKMYGPTGIGVCYVSDRMLSKLNPITFGGDMIESVSKERTTFTNAPLKFEAGTPPIAEVIGLHAAVDYIQSKKQDDINMNAKRLTEILLREFERMSDIQVIGRAHERGPVISFTIDGIHPHDIGSILDTENIAVRVGHHCSQPTMRRFNLPATVRVAFGIYNNEDDIVFLLKGLERVIEVFKQ